MKRLTILTGILLTIFLVQSAMAGDYSLRGKTKLELDITARDYSQKLDYLDPYDRDNSFDDGQISFGVSHFTTENSAVTFMITAAEVSSDRYYDDYGSFTLRSSIVPIFWGSRFYMTDHNGYSPVKPYLAISGGPVLGVNNYKSLGGSDVLLEDDVYLAFGAYFGGGIDFMFGENMMLGINGGYNAFSDFKEYIGERDNYSGAELGISFGFLFGGPSHYDRDYDKPTKRKKRVKKF